MSDELFRPIISPKTEPEFDYTIKIPEKEIIYFIKPNESNFNFNIIENYTKSIDLPEDTGVGKKSYIEEIIIGVNEKGRNSSRTIIQGFNNNNNNFYSFIDFLDPSSRKLPDSLILRTRTDDKEGYEEVSKAFKKAETQIKARIGKELGIGYFENFLNKVSAERREQFLEMFAPEFDRIRELSRTKLVDMVRGRTTNPEDLGPEDKTVFETIFSLPERIREVQRKNFYTGLSVVGWDKSDSHLFEVSSFMRDPNSRVVIEERLSEIETERTSAFVMRAKDEVPEVDMTQLGLSVHASNFLNVLKSLRPDLHMLGVDKFDEVAKQWKVRNWFAQNQTNGPANNFRGGLPRGKGDLFPLGLVGAMRVPFLSSCRWPNGSDAAIAMRWNINESLDSLLAGHEIVEVKPFGEGKYDVTAVNPNGDETKFRTKYLMATGLFKERVPVREDYRKIWSSEIDNTWNVLSSQDEIQGPLVLTYEQYSAMMQTVEGQMFLLGSTEGNSSKRIGVVGSGDGANTVVSSLLGIGTGYRVPVQALYQRPKIVWIGQDADTPEKFIKKTRGRYSQICTGFTGGNVRAVDGRLIGVDKEGNQSLISRISQGDDRSVLNEPLDVLISCAGYEPTKTSELFDGISLGETRIVRDDEGRGLYKQIKGHNIGIIGPSSGILPSETDLEVSELLNNLGVGENLVANWWRGIQTQRSGLDLANKLPLGEFASVYVRS